MMRTLTDRPGLYDPAYEHDACGVGFVADATGAAGRRALVGALRALDNLAHRGAVGADARTSDGAGILTQVPNRFLCAILPELAGQPVPPLGDLAAGTIFLARADTTAPARGRAMIEAALAAQKKPFLDSHEVGHQHQHVVDALRRGDGRGARDEVVHHLTLSRDRMIAILRAKREGGLRDPLLESQR